MDTKGYIKLGLLGAGAVVCLGLVGSFQNFEVASVSQATRGVASISASDSKDDELADDTVTLAENHTILPSITETVGSVRDQKIVTNQLSSLPSIFLPKSHMQSMGAVAGQRMEVELNGSVKFVYVYSQDESSGQGIYINSALAKDLGAKIGDKLTLRLLSEQPPQITEKPTNDWLIHN